MAQSVKSGRRGEAVSILTPRVALRTPPQEVNSPVKQRAPPGGFSSELTRTLTSRRNRNQDVPEMPGTTQPDELPSPVSNALKVQLDAAKQTGDETNDAESGQAHELGNFGRW